MSQASRVVLALIASLGLFAIQFEGYAAPQEDTIYDKLFPLSAEYCGLTSIAKKPGFGANVIGGNFGHGVVYLRGACSDSLASFPQLKSCDGQGGEGVGISVSSDFQNVNWVAVPDKNFFFHGVLKPGEPLTANAYYETETRAKTMGILSQIVIHPELYKNAPNGMTHEEFKYEDSFGTDYGVNLGRRMYCVHVPLTSGQLAEIIRFLNATNQHYHQTQDFTWSVTNNCSTLDYNIFTQAGFWEPLPVDAPLYALGDIGIPMNVFVDLTKRVNDLPLEDLGRLFQDRALRKMMMEQGRLPIQPGGITEYVPIHAPNAVYLTDFGGGQLIDFPLLQPKNEEIKQDLQEARYTDLKTNLEYFLERFQKIKSSKKPWQEYIETSGLDQSSWIGFQSFYEKYFQYVEFEISDVQRKLSKLPD